MKSSAQCRKQHVLDAQVEHTTLLLDPRQDMIAKSALTTHSIPEPAALRPASAGNALTDCLHRQARILKTSAYKNAPLARFPVLDTYRVPHVRLEQPLSSAPNWSVIVGLAAQAPSPVLMDRLNATNALPELGAPQQVKAV